MMKKEKSALKIFFFIEYFARMKKLYNFASLVPAKPLVDAQMRGAFFVSKYGKKKLHQNIFQSYRISSTP